MSAANSFFDTNVLLYLLSKDAAKADLAEALLATGGVVSVQVLNEFASVATRKLAMTIPEIREILSTIRAVCVVRSLDIETHDLGLEMAERYGFSIYDGLIVAAAVRAGCAILYTEDLQQGQVIDQLTISKSICRQLVSMSRKNRQRQRHDIFTTTSRAADMAGDGSGTDVKGRTIRVRRRERVISWRLIIRPIAVID